nr:RNA-directed DNA polymerase, eukaryota, reverse transcriptase zinc-binding domain protein [Tanacetum cinerariifolium]
MERLRLLPPLLITVILIPFSSFHLGGSNITNLGGLSGRGRFDGENQTRSGVNLSSISMTRPIIDSSGVLGGDDCGYCLGDVGFVVGAKDSSMVGGVDGLYDVGGVYEGGGINATTRKVYPSSVWINVLKIMDSIKEHGIDLLACCDRRIGNGCSTKFWSDKWAENGILKDIFPRVYALELDKSITVAAKKVQGTGTDSLRRHPRGGVESV